MMYLLTFYRQKLLLTAAILALLLWAVSSTVWAIRQKPQTIVIGLTPTGAMLINDGKDRAGEIETENFLRRFVALAFNYNQNTFEENVSFATDLMSEELFNRQVPELRRVADSLKGRTLDQSATVSSIKRIEPGRFEIMLKTSQVLDMRNQTFDTRVRVKIAPSERTTRNPWGLEVTEYSYERP